MRALVLLVLAFAGSTQAATFSGRHWQVGLDHLACEADRALVAIGLRIRYQGPAGLAEAPVSQLVDGNGKIYPPRSLVWKRGGKSLAAWLTAGGMKTVQPGDASEMELRFEAREMLNAPGVLKLEFGDLAPLSLTRAGANSGKDACARLLKPAQVEARPARGKPGGGTSMIRVYRAAYPCRPEEGGALRTIEAQYPPYLPEQLLVFGRGYLPSLRQVELPMGRAPAQTYAYSGRDDLEPFEAFAKRAVLEDFPGFGARHFAFNWGTQDAAGGNKVYSIGLYAAQACPK